jgi:chemotaxis protein CheD
MMRKPDDLLEIYLTPGEFQFGDASMRVRTLLGEGGVFTLWHRQRHIGGIGHFRTARRAVPSPHLDPAYAEEGLALAMLEMARARTRPGDYVANLFVFDSADSEELMAAATELLDFYGIQVKVAFIGRGNLVFDLWNGEVWMQKRAPAFAKAGKSPDSIVEVYLHPGEWYFGDEDTRIKTLLGSCVSFTLWHPERRIGGMCHYMLPRRGDKRGNEALDGKYADEAMALLLREIEREGTRPEEYVARVFGGGSMLDLGGINVSELNVETARDLIKQHGFRMEGECLGGVGHRNIVFDVWSGEVWLKKGGK